MKFDDVDRILANEARITPSPEFLASVMSAVKREAASLPPLAFPWIRALPGFLATIVAIVAAMWHGIGVLSEPAASTAIRQQVTQISALASGLGLQWILLAVVITIVSIALSSKWVRGGSFA